MKKTTQQHSKENKTGQITFSLSTEPVIYLPQALFCLVNY